MLLVLALLGLFWLVINPLVLWLSAKIVRIPNIGLKRAYATWALLWLLSLAMLLISIAVSNPVTLAMAAVGELVLGVWLVKTLFRTRWLRAVGSYAISVALPVGVALGVRAVGIEAFYVPTPSMEPTIMAGERVLVNKLAPHFRRPTRDEVVVYKDPAGVTFVKRVIGVEGDKLELSGDALLVNGAPSGSCKIITQLSEGTKAMQFPIVVPPGKLFLLGDSRDWSVDSRYQGFSDVHDVIGFPTVVYASVSVPANPYLARRTQPQDGAIRWGRIGTIVR